MADPLIRRARAADAAAVADVQLRSFHAALPTIRLAHSDDEVRLGPYYRAMELAYYWRATFDDAEVNALHAEGFGHRVDDREWAARVQRHSLGWVCARAGDELVGFVNVAWDGGAHAFILDTLVSARASRQGVGTRMIAVATEQARVAGCAWLHADFADELSAFYIDACGFVPTPAGLIALQA